MRFKSVPGSFAICKLRRSASVRDWSCEGPFYSVTITPEEVSIICPELSAPKDAKVETGFLCLEVEGPFQFSAVGILASFLSPLAQAGVPIFALSTYNTDYVLVKHEIYENALAALCKAGHELVS